MLKPRTLELVIKRALDVMVCAILLVVLVPLLAVLAVLVRLSSPGPVLFVQDRIGLNGRSFRMFKFRSMSGAPRDNQMSWTEIEEQRITPVGRFLREYGLDELPQLLNIVRGEMSIIGPRPPLPVQAESFGDFERRMFRMRPGVLALSAIRGRYSLTFEQRTRLNVEYVDTWTLGSDRRILLRTAVVVLGRRNAAESRTVREEKPDARD